MQMKSKLQKQKSPNPPNPEVGWNNMHEDPDKNEGLNAYYYDDDITPETSGYYNEP